MYSLVLTLLKHLHTLLLSNIPLACSGFFPHKENNLKSVCTQDCHIYWDLPLLPQDYTPSPSLWPDYLHFLQLSLQHFLFPIW